MLRDVDDMEGARMVHFPPDPVSLGPTDVITADRTSQQLYSHTSHTSHTQTLNSL